MKKSIKYKVVLLLALAGFLWAGSSYAADVSVSLRYQSNLVFQGQVALPAPGTVTLNDMNGVGRTVNTQSVLALLAAIDSTNPAFSISKLQYFPGFSPPSLYLKCIQILGEAGEACDNWLYVVNGTSPALGMDQYILSGGEQVYVYFGPSRRVYMENSQVGNSGTFIVSAQTYNYQDNTWSPATGVTIGVFTGDYWAPTITATQAVNQTGQAVFQLSTLGTYGVGIQEDFYYPNMTLQVIQAGGSGGGVPAPAHDMLNVKTAISFLLSFQNEDGSFRSSPMLSDWAALALSSYSSPETERAKHALRNHLLGDPSAGTFLTDYERRAMALMALEVNPYSDTPTNYIQKIIDGFDGEQFGDPNLINDDIFAFLALVKAGYQSSDTEIKKTIAFILNRQESNGSFQGVDITAAAIQALALVSGAEGVQGSLARAREYLKEQQKDSGGFGNVYATSWVMQAIATLGESEFSWIKGGYTPGDYLFSQQAEDGGVESLSTLDNRIWATSYAIPAALGKDWGKILIAFAKPGLAPLEISPVQGFSRAQYLARETTESLTGLDPVLAAEIQFQLDAIAQETRILTLEVVALELQGVAVRVAALEPRVLAFVESADGRNLVAKDEATKFLSTLQESLVTAESIVGSELSASVGEAARTQLPWQELIPYIVGGGVLMFLLFGNPNVLLNLVKQLRLLN